jgi:hypothetical protein
VRVGTCGSFGAATERNEIKRFQSARVLVSQFNRWIVIAKRATTPFWTIVAKTAASGNARFTGRVADEVKLDQDELIEAQHPTRSLVPVDVDVTVEEVR